jgi:uncharacterized protein (UPF0248 family)
MVKSARYTFARRSPQAERERHKGKAGHRSPVGLHELLSELEWRAGLKVKNLEFLIVDRGSPGDVRSVSAPELVGRDRSYLHLDGGGRIPYHRVLEVRVGKRVVWSREGPKEEESA